MLNGTPCRLAIVGAKRIAFARSHTACADLDNRAMLNTPCGLVEVSCPNGA